MHDIYMIIPGSPCSNAVQSKYELDRRRGRGHPHHPPHPLKMGVWGFFWEAKASLQEVRVFLWKWKVPS